VAEPIRLWAALTGAATAGEKLPPARITLPDGTTISTEQPDAARILSCPDEGPFRPFLFFSAFVKNNKGLSGFPYLLGRQSTQRLI
jgi:hypothetical protein